MRIDDYNVPSTSLKVRQNFTIQSKSLGGNSSATGTAHQGIKPKMLRVSLLIRSEDEKELTGLVNIAESRDDNGDLVVYTITDKTANRSGIKQVTFDGEFSATKDDSIDAWRVSFSLMEKQSTAEKVEQRQELETPSNQSSTNSGSVVTGEETEPLQGVEAYLKKLDTALS